MKSIYFLILFSFTIYAQHNDFLNLYQNFIPGEVKSLSIEQREMINKQMSGKLTVKPELAYSFIEYLTLRYGENVTDDEKNLLNNHRYLTALAYKEKNAWIDRQIEILDSKYSNHPEYKVARRFLNSRRNAEFEPVKSHIEVKYDNNKEAFYALIFVSNNSAITYDPSADYISKLSSSRKASIDMLHISALSGDDINSKFENNFFVDNWTIFEEFAGKNEYKDFSFYLLKYLELYTDTRFPLHAAIFTGASYSSISSVEHSYSLPVFERSFSFSEKYTDIQLNSGLQLSYHFTGKKKFLKYILIEGGFSQTLLNDQKTLKENPYTEQGTDYTARLVRNINEIVVTNQNSWHIKISAPVLYLNDYISIDLGAQYVAHTIKYSWYGEYEFEYENNNIIYDEEEFYYANNNYKKVNQSIMPTIDLTFNFFPNVYVKAGGSYNFFGVRISYAVFPGILDLTGALL